MPTLFDEVIAHLTADMRAAVARRWPEIDVTTLDDLQVAKLFDEIAREREEAVTAVGMRSTGPAGWRVEPRRKPSDPIGQSPVAGGLIGSAGAEPGSTVFDSKPTPPRPVVETKGVFPR